MTKGAGSGPVLSSSYTSCRAQVASHKQAPVHQRVGVVVSPRGQVWCRCAYRPSACQGGPVRIWPTSVCPPPARRPSFLPPVGPSARCRKFQSPEEVATSHHRAPSRTHMNRVWVQTVHPKFKTVFFDDPWGSVTRGKPAHIALASWALGGWHFETHPAKLWHSDGPGGLNSA